eukprot:GHVQ01004995.1.p1 GENE.GHVQ01004995.1~~GHVQ01004995.1.p1  ORF type:complete len:362 (+),score=46.51 GHVQ01004995.1:76-1161(+)
MHRIRSTTTHQLILASTTTKSPKTKLVCGFSKTIYISSCHSPLTPLSVRAQSVSTGTPLLSSSSPTSPTINTIPVLPTQNLRSSSSYRQQLYHPLQCPAVLSMLCLSSDTDRPECVTTVARSAASCGVARQIMSQSQGFYSVQDNTVRAAVVPTSTPCGGYTDSISYMTSKRTLYNHSLCQSTQQLRYLTYMPYHKHISVYSLYASSILNIKPIILNTNSLPPCSSLVNYNIRNSLSHTNKTHPQKSGHTVTATVDCGRNTITANSTATEVTYLRHYNHPSSSTVRSSFQASSSGLFLGCLSTDRGMSVGEEPMCRPGHCGSVFFQVRWKKRKRKEKISQNAQQIETKSSVVYDYSILIHQ